jgi:uncharacterized membrane protein YgaE (UPF0421/DUF939 family)
MTAAWERLKEGLWPALQQALAAVIAWWGARLMLDHHVPFFAPAAALVALNMPRGARGAHAVRVFFSVVGGVLIGEVVFTLHGRAVWGVGVAVLFALLLALLVDGERTTMSQASVSAVIAVAAGEQAGVNRVLDVLVGCGVALVFSQLLFPAHPIGMLRRAESAMLSDLADALGLTARALERDRRASEHDLWIRLRPVYDVLSDLGRTRNDTIAAIRHVPAWWGQREPVRRERQAALRLDLLGSSCLTLARAATALDNKQQRALAPDIRELRLILRLLAAALGNHAVRRRAVQRALRVVAGRPADGTAEQIAARESVRAVVRDILVFAGTTEEEADQAIRAEEGEPRVDVPPRLRRPRPQLPPLGWRRP